MRKIGKVITAALMLASITSTVAFASGDSCDFTYKGSDGNGVLDVSWYVDDPDKGEAETAYSGTNAYAAVYLEATKIGQNPKKTFQCNNSRYADATIRTNTTRFNSTHGVVSKSNTYKWLASDTCTDW